MKELKVQTYYRFKECSKCEKGKMNVFSHKDGLLMSMPPKSNYKCDLCDNEEILTESEWPGQVLKFIDEEDK